jgi:pimeloyl-ACP methyl ester carboxylesterase
MVERMIEADGAALCTEPFGDPADPAILLIMGIGASMLWWEADFCQMLADNGRFVIRYDHRDTGRSVTSSPATPRTTGPTWSPTPPECSMPMVCRRPTSSASRRAGPSRSSSR